MATLPMRYYTGPYTKRTVQELQNECNALQKVVLLCSKTINRTVSSGASIRQSDFTFPHFFLLFGSYGYLAYEQLCWLCVRSGR